jgi:hypothetical protein
MGHSVKTKESNKIPNGNKRYSGWDLNPVPLCYGARISNPRLESRKHFSAVEGSGLRAVGACGLLVSAGGEMRFLIIATTSSAGSLDQGGQQRGPLMLDRRTQTNVCSATTQKLSPISKNVHVEDRMN